MEDLQSYFILTLVSLLSAVLIGAVFAKSRAAARLPPSPLALPMIGHLNLLSRGSAHQALHRLSARHGPLIRLSLGSVPCLLVSSSEFAKQFLKTQETSFSNRPRTIAADHISYGSAGLAFAPFGAHWKFMRRLCASRLLGGQTLDDLLPLRRDEIARFLRSMAKKGENSEAVDVEGELLRLTNNVISRMAMSRRCSEDDGEAGEIRELVKATAELTGEFNLSDYIWIFRHLDLQGFRPRLEDFREKFDGLMGRILKERERDRKEGMERGGESKDLLDILIDISEDESSEIGLTRESIKAFILVETSLAAMVQCFEWRVEGGGERVDMEEGNGMTLLKARPLVCVPLSRFSPLPI